MTETKQLTISKAAWKALKDIKNRLLQRTGIEPSHSEAILEMYSKWSKEKE